MSDCTTAVAHYWLPVSSTAQLIDDRCCQLQHQANPGGLAMLGHLSLSSCKHLVEDWLPVSSTAQLRSVSLTRATSSGRGMVALEDIIANDVTHSC
jgi:hypothetical protein